jgi:hypothetical protein
VPGDLGRRSVVQEAQQDRRAVGLLQLEHRLRDPALGFGLDGQLERRG